MASTKLLWLFFWTVLLGLGSSTKPVKPPLSTHGVRPSTTASYEPQPPAATTVASASPSASVTEGQCRSGKSPELYMDPPQFELHSCALCYDYLARGHGDRVRALPRYLPYLYVLHNLTADILEHTFLLPNVTSPSDVDKVCSTLPDATCQRWRQCCQAARRCCRQQLSSARSPDTSCPPTWDGFACWEAANPGEERYLPCPAFLPFAFTASFARKMCQANGTWYALYHRARNSWSEWTDYTICADKQRLVTSVYLALSCNACSILFLVPAVLIFLAYRSLRRQHRIRLHINFFAALLFDNAMSILWDVIVTYDRLTSDSSNTTPVLLADGAGCKVLSFCRLYFKSTTYVWMFCEGFYLHRLISNAFRPPKSLGVLYGCGWGVPLFYCGLYIILRGIYANDSCWANPFGHLEWIIYFPNAFCLIVNLLFLCNILRVLLTQLQTHPNEPSNFRRALKATFVLVPLFGVQLFVTIYRLPAGQPGASEYEQFTAFVINSQGFFVALIFCFFNGEVIAQMKRTCTRLNLLRPGSEITSRGTTLATSVHHREEDPETHPLAGGGSHVGHGCGGTNGSVLHHNGIGPGRALAVSLATANGGKAKTTPASAFVAAPPPSLTSASQRPGRVGSECQAREDYSYIPMHALRSSDNGGLQIDNV